MKAIKFIAAILLILSPGCGDNLVSSAFGRKYISLYEIIANPNNFDEKEVTVFGILAYTIEDVWLFPTRETYENQFWGDMFSIHAKRSEETGITHQFLLNAHGKYVEVTGVFRTHKDNEIAPGFGSFVDISKIELRHKPGTKSPEEKK